MIIIEDYEIIHNENNNSIAFGCNSRIYKVQNHIYENDENYFCSLDEQNNLNIYNSENNKIVSFLLVPEEYKEVINKRGKVIIISGEPSAHEDEPSDIEKISVITVKRNI